MKSLLFAASIFALALVPSSAAAQQRPDAGAPSTGAPAVREVEIIVENGYTPSVIEITEGQALRLRFVRHDYSPCSREVVFPSQNIRRMLPTNQPVVIDLPALAVGEHPFQCWMNMLRGRIVVRPRPAVSAPTVAAPIPPQRPTSARPSRRR